MDSCFTVSRSPLEVGRDKPIQHQNLYWLAKNTHDEIYCRKHNTAGICGLRSTHALVNPNLPRLKAGGSPQQFPSTAVIFLLVHISKTTCCLRCLLPRLVESCYKHDPPPSPSHINTALVPPPRGLRHVFMGFVCWLRATSNVQFLNLLWNVFVSVCALSASLREFSVWMWS